MIEANGLSFHVEDEGSGTPVVLLHGFPDTSRLWRQQVEALVRAGYRAIAPDLRGRGRSGRPPAVADYALQLVVQDVAAIMDALGVRRAHVVGHDWGAAVAWLLASLMPDRVDRLVALSVGFPGAAGPPDLEALQKGWYRLLFQFEGVAEDLVRRNDWYLMRVLLGSNADLETCLRDLSEPESLTAALNWYRANLPVERLLPSGSGPQLPPVQAPTLGIWSAGDEYLTEQAMIRSADHVQGPWRYVRIEAASHWIALDQPQFLNALLLDFLGG
ncbi:MAG TPA: alpha/beta hydrolase [Terriglobales bacterium]|nr:alpha/beta hydrolase [Terriglobales bacterium]